MAFEWKAIKERTRRILDPLIYVLAAAGVSPMLVSLAGLAASACGAWVIGRGSLFWGGVWTLVSGICDVLDGGLARERGRQTRFGAFIDSTFDRVSELLIYGAILIYFSARGYPLVLLVVICVAMGASFLVSYARARIEGLGYECTVGLLERPERVAILITGLLLGRRALIGAIFLIAFGAAVTVIQRIQHAYDVTRAEPGQDPRRADK
jgi:CDP-diacylglycerol--glycerol-3-phosphate 3-phosphatidyltransferase